MNGKLTGGLLTWAEFAARAAGMTGFWQDLDGLHRAPLPATSPPTSLVHAWDDTGRLARARIEGGTAYVAWLSPDPEGGTGIVATAVEPRGNDTQVRWAADSVADLPLGLIQVVDLGEGGLSFVCDASALRVWS